MDGAQRAYCKRSLRRVLRVSADAPGELMERLWRNPQQVIQSGEPLHAHQYRATVRVESQDRSYVIKHYAINSRREFFKQLARPSRAWKTWSAGLRFVELGINTPRPVAVVENTWWPLRGESYLVYPYIEGETLKTWFDSQSTCPAETWNLITRQFIDIWHRLLRNRISLADPHLANFVLDKHKRLWVIDLDHTKFHWHHKLTARKHDHCWRMLRRSAERIGPRAQKFVDHLQQKLRRPVRSRVA